MTEQHYQEQYRAMETLRKRKFETISVIKKQSVEQRPSVPDANVDGPPSKKIKLENLLEEFSKTITNYNDADVDENVEMHANCIKDRLDKIISNQENRRREILGKADEAFVKIEKTTNKRLKKWGMENEYNCSVCFSFFPRSLHHTFRSFPCHEANRICACCYQALWKCKKDVIDYRETIVTVSDCPFCKRTYRRRLEEGFFSDQLVEIPRVDKANNNTVTEQRNQGDFSADVDEDERYEFLFPRL